MEKVFISNVLDTEKVQEFRTGIPILTQAGTGTGKSYWIKTVVIPYYLSIGKKVIFFHNRYAQGMQNEFDVKELECENLLLLSYQKLEAAIEANIVTRKTGKESHEMKQLLQWIESSHVLVLDEAQYFIMDSEFNTHTQDSFDFITNIIKSKITIWLTATPAGMFDYMKNNMSLKVEEYVFKDDYSHVSTITMFSDKGFSEDEEETDRQLNKIIKKGLSKGKVFIAVDSKELAFSIHKKYKNISAAMFAGDTYNGVRSLCIKKYEPKLDDSGKPIIDSNGEMIEITTGYEDNRMINMLKDCRFPKEITILITTAVMETGFNIKDKDVKTVIIMNRDILSAKQFAGRIRGIGIEKHVDMYIWAANANTLVNSLKELKESRKEIQRIKEGTFDAYNRYKSKGMFKYFNRDLTTKPLAILNLERKIAYIETLIADTDGFKTKTLSKHIVEQFGIKPEYYGATQSKTTIEQKRILLWEAANIQTKNKKGIITAIGELRSAKTIKEFMTNLGLVKYKEYGTNRTFTQITKWTDVVENAEWSHLIEELGYKITGRVNSKDVPIIKIERIAEC